VWRGDVNTYRRRLLTICEAEAGRSDLGLKQAGTLVGVVLLAVLSAFIRAGRRTKRIILKSGGRILLDAALADSLGRLGPARQLRLAPVS
jgi:hypothetical protein